MRKKNTPKIETSKLSELKPNPFEFRRRQPHMLDQAKMALALLQDERARAQGHWA
jgi:hypothetical protein